MLRTSLAARCCGACAGVVAALVFCAESLALAAPINGGVQAPTPDVFYNFYASPVAAGNAPGLGAQLYVSPRPVPPRVGHTWITYLTNFSTGITGGISALPVRWACRQWPVGIGGKKRITP